MRNPRIFPDSLTARAMHWVYWLAAAAIMSSLSTMAFANGRYPRGQYLKESSGDPNSLVLSATYGLLVTADRGRNWYLVCERGLYGALPGSLEIIESVLELTASGALLSGSDRALRVSRDRGCSFTTETALPVMWNWYDASKTNDKGYVADLTLEKAKGDKAVLALVADENGPASGLQIYESLDDARTWKPLGKPILPPMLISGITLDVAPSDGKRLYVSGRSRPGPMAIVASSDGGETWIASDVPDSADSNGTYIAAVSANDPNALYVRTSIWLPDPDGELAQDRLHFSNDGGKTWTEVLRKNAKLMGFALSPDGKTVLAGYGDPAEPDGRHVDDADVGIYRADNGTSNFTKIYDGSISCLTWNRTGVYACAKQDRDGFHLGFAPDASFDVSNKNAFERLLSLPNVRGPLPWAPGSGESVCAGDWIGMLPDKLGVCSLFGACADGGVASGGPALCGTTIIADGGDGSAGGAGGNAGAGGAASGGAPRADGGGAAGTRTGEAGGASPFDGPSDGCTCSLSGASSCSPVPPWAPLAMIAACCRRRRREQASCHGPARE